jgi:hypothetical protein
VPAALIERATQPGERPLLRGRERVRLRLAGQRVPLGRLRQFFAASALRRSDERQRAPRRRPVVVSEPESELDERRRQRLDDELDRSSTATTAPRPTSSGTSYVNGRANARVVTSG